MRTEKFAPIDPINHTTAYSPAKDSLARGQGRPRSQVQILAGVFQKVLEEEIEKLKTKGGADDTPRSY